VRNHTAKNLERMALKQSDDCILPLAALLQQVSGSVPLLIELKDQTGDLSSSNGDLERATAKALQPYKGAVAVMSFNPFSVLEMQRQAPQIARGLTTEAFTKQEWPKISKDKRLNLTNMSDFEKCGASFISHHHEDLESAPVRALKAKGIPILCWTIETKAQQHAARQLADNFTFEGFQPATSY
jgi:glycerophosphoryl diester phosphodiesterase